MKNKALRDALVWIGVYVALFSITDGLSETIGVEKILTAPAAVALSLFLWQDICRKGKREYYGFTSMKILDYKALLYMVPFMAMVGLNLFHGIEVKNNAWEIALYIVSMCCVGFLEECIFRGLLFRALQPEGTKMAIIISGVTFGFGHIVNLLNGAQFLPTMMQLVYATAVGLCFSIFFYKTGNLVPCVICHALVNSVSIFSAEISLAQQAVTSALLIMIAAAYSLWLLHLPGKNSAA